MTREDVAEDKFLRNELFIGLLNKDKKEVESFDYERIPLNNKIFKKTNNGRYTNSFAFGFPETLFNWGEVSYVAVFYGNDKDILGLDYSGKQPITSKTTVLFLDGNFNIEFI